MYACIYVHIMYINMYMCTCTYQHVHIHASTYGVSISISHAEWAPRKRAQTWSMSRRLAPTAKPCRTSRAMRRCAWRPRLAWEVAGERKHGAQLVSTGKTVHIHIIYRCICKYIGFQHVHMQIYTYVNLESQRYMYTIRTCVYKTVRVYHKLMMCT